MTPPWTHSLEVKSDPSGSKEITVWAYGRRGRGVVNYTHTLPECLEKDIRERIRRNEDKILSENAAKTADALRRRVDKKRPDIRADYSRDADRIIHTRAYTRYIDKTQVFFFVENDHITHRVLHVQMVSKIGRTIGRALRLNEDLIEAIAIGHDIGHTAFGHTGEACLSALCKENGIGRFCHNVQSVHFLEDIEECNLTLQVLDGILSHNGEVHERVLRPALDKDWAQLDKEIGAMIHQDIRSTSDHPPVFPPKTMEGCVVRIADLIAYVGRDIEDALELRLLDNRESIPSFVKERLGVYNADIINSLIVDVVENSYDQDHIALSQEASDALETLKNFNYNQIYLNEKIACEKEKICSMYRTLFDKSLEDLMNGRRSATIFRQFCDLDWIGRSYMDRASGPEKVRDYIAGMTDGYFENKFKECTLPTKRIDFRD